MQRLFLILFLFVVLLTPATSIMAQSKALGGEPVRLVNPLSGSASSTEKTNVSEIIGIIIRGIMGVIGAVVLLMFIWGAYSWLASAGNAEKIATGTKTMLFAALGLFIVFFAYVFLNVFLRYLKTGGF